MNNPEPDPNIKVSITDIEDPYCFRVDCYGVTLHLHAMSFEDMLHKMNKEYMEWLRLCTELLIQAQ